MGKRRGDREWTGAGFVCGQEGPGVWVGEGAVDIVTKREIEGRGGEG